MTTLQTPQTIRATIHEDAINKVAGFFNATTKDILNELLQNSRRSGATQVEIITQGDQVTVIDDGAGISDPAAILAFGHTAWENRAAQNEHAAGMGFYALARSDQVRVRSKLSGGTAWQVNLTPDHFVGKMSAPVEEPTGDTTVPGTTVAFTSRKDPYSDIIDAARYYPLPVHLNGQRVDQKDFLREAAYVETWEGVRIGVYPGYHLSASDRMNFHGIIVNDPRLPRVSAIQQNWRTQADVLDCPHLELTLPARREVIETPFMTELRTACTRAIFRSMSLQTEPPDVPWKVQQEAASMGINLPDAAAVLELWKPRYHDSLSRNYQKRVWVGIPDDAIVANVGHNVMDAQALWRAIELNGMKERFMQADEGLEGYNWYDSLPKAQSIRITVTKDGEKQDLQKIRDERGYVKNQRPDRITFALETVGKDYQPDEEEEEKETSEAGEHTILVLPSDLAFENDEDDYGEQGSPLVTQNSEISVRELTDLMMDAFFSANDDSSADSYETQREEYEMQSEKIALMLLSSEDDALKATLDKLISRHIAWEIPNGTTATIRIKDRKAVEITLESTEKKGA